LLAILTINLNKAIINSIFDNALTLKLKHIFALSIIFLILVLINIQKINRDLTGDELSYALNSIEHSLGILDRIFEKLPAFIQNRPASQSIQLTTLFIFLSMILFSKIILKLKKDINFTLIIMIATILSRIVISIAGGKNYPNSPVPSFFSLVTTSLFGVNGLTYRLTTLLIFATLATYVFFCFSRFGNLGYVFAFLTLSLFTTSSLLSYTITSNEIANYTLVVGLSCMFALFRNDFIVKPVFLLILSAAFYLRVNIIVFLIIFLIMHLHQNKNQFSKFLNFYILILSLISPGIFIVFENRLKSRISTESNFGEEIRQNTVNFFSSMVSSKIIPLLILALTTLAILFCRKESRIFAFLYMAINFILYFIVNSSELTKDVKYLIEYLYPLSLSLGMLVLITFENKLLIKVCLIVLMVMVNLQGIADSRELKLNFVRNQIESRSSGIDSELFLSFKPLPYGQIFNYTKSHDLKNCFNSGVVYGVTSEIMAGYNLKDIRYLSAQRSNFLSVQSHLNEKWTSISPESASKSKIDCVIIGNVDKKKLILETFTRAEWVLEANFTDSNFGTKAFILINKKEVSVKP